jgi:hypothetical protein
MSSNILIEDKGGIDECKKKGAIDGKNSVLLNPAAFNLYTQEQMDAIGSYESGKNVGIGEITSNPAANNLYTKAQYEAHSIPHKVRVMVEWKDCKPAVHNASATYVSKIYVDGVLKDSYTENNNMGVRNIYKHNITASGPDVDYITIGG